MDLEAYHGYSPDPVGFVRDVLGLDPWRKQVEILEAVRDHSRVTVRACHGVGKTFIAAGTGLWWLLAFPNAVVVTTAPTGRQVKELLWREIRRMHRKSRQVLPGDVRETSVKVSDDVYALGFSTDESDRFQGFHSRHLLIIVDEASGLPESIYESIDGCLTTIGSHLLLIGNPLRIGDPVEVRIALSYRPVVPFRVFGLGNPIALAAQSVIRYEQFN